jgi:hypothetical protein
MNRRIGVFGLVANASTVRAAYYRDKAARLRELADAEPVSHYRAKLIDVSEQFEELADRVSKG